MNVKHGAIDEATGKRYSLQRSGHCQTGGHATCKWDGGYETPSVIIVCSCECHDTARTMKPKGQSVAAVPGRLVPKK